ncbi:MAG: cupin domain-containing protein [Synergistales bacterium]|nr:cupin domain-containing protein [Synergistales bacterium]
MNECTQTNLAGSLRDIEPEPETGGFTKRIVFGPGRFWEDYVMRLFTLAPQGTSPHHSHHWPHYILVQEGAGRAVIDGDTYEIEAGSWAHVPPNVEHHLENGGDGPFSFICIVPRHGEPSLQE